MFRMIDSTDFPKYKTKFCKNLTEFTSIKYFKFYNLAP